MLTAADLSKGRTMTCHPHVRIEVERTGGVYSPKAAVRDEETGHSPNLDGASWSFTVKSFACLGCGTVRICRADRSAGIGKIDLPGMSQA